MAWIRVESSVARNRKFVKAGPAPSWLWLCGLAYCQEGLTDGFIPDEALNYLGVKNARQLASHLVGAGLWDVADGGWQVHDYLEHNRSASDVETIRAKRGSGGKLGGRPKKNLLETSKVSHVKPSAENVKTHAVAVVVDDVVAVADLEGGPGETDLPPFDVAFQRFVAAYPGQGRCASNLAMTAFVDVLSADPSVPHPFAFSALMARLDGHKRSHQWRVKQMIPRLDRYLREGLHLQELPEVPVASVVSEKTARNLTSAAEFVKAGTRAAQ